MKHSFNVEGKKKKEGNPSEYGIPIYTVHLTLMTLSWNGGFSKLKILNSGLIPTMSISSLMEYQQIFFLLLTEMKIFSCLLQSCNFIQWPSVFVEALPLFVTDLHHSLQKSSNIQSKCKQAWVDLFKCLHCCYQTFISVMWKRCNSQIQAESVVEFALDYLVRDFITLFFFHVAKQNDGLPHIYYKYVP